MPPPTNNRSEDVIVDGDYCMGVCDLVTSSRPCTYVTMLREPRERTASSYLYCKRKPDDQLCATHLRTRGERDETRFS